MHILKENVEDMLPFDMFSNVLEYTIIHQFLSKNLYLINISLYYNILFVLSDTGQGCCTKTLGTSGIGADHGRAKTYDQSARLVNIW